MQGPISEHLAHMRYLGRRPGTIYQRQRHLHRLATWVHPGLLLEADEMAVYAFCAQPALGAEARASAVSHVRSFYRWALANDLIVVDPSRKLDRPRRPRRQPRPMPEAQLRYALEHAEEPIRAWIYLAAFAGLRCAEISPLRGEDRHGAVLIIREQKGGDEGSVPISPILDRAVSHLPARGVWFPRWDGNPAAISAGQLQRHANRFLHNLGIGQTMHTLRHRYVTMVYKASGRDLRLTQELARHRSISSTVGYTWVDPGPGGSVVAQLPDAG